MTRGADGTGPFFSWLVVRFFLFPSLLLYPNSSFLAGFRQFISVLLEHIGGFLENSETFRRSAPMTFPACLTLSGSVPILQYDSQFFRLWREVPAYDTCIKRV